MTRGLAGLSAVYFESWTSTSFSHGVLWNCFFGGIAGALARCGRAYRVLRRLGKAQGHQLRGCWSTQSLLSTLATMLTSTRRRPFLSPTRTAAHFLKRNVSRICIRNAGACNCRDSDLRSNLCMLKSLMRCSLTGVVGMQGIKVHPEAVTLNSSTEGLLYYHGRTDACHAIYFTRGRSIEWITRTSFDDILRANP